MVLLVVSGDCLVRVNNACSLFQGGEKMNYFIMASSVLTTLIRCFKAERAESFHYGLVRVNNACYVVSRRREADLFYYGLVRVNNACSLFQGGESSNYFTIVSFVLTTLVRCFKAERTELFYYASSVLTTLVRCFMVERR